VILDDIISLEETMIKVIRELRRHGYVNPYCVAVHAVFSDDSYYQLLESGACDVVTTNTITHISSMIDISPLVRFPVPMPVV
jgi:ribose-phosphate pyrophosphokinase